MKTEVRCNAPTDGFHCVVVAEAYLARTTKYTGAVSKDKEEGTYGNIQTVS